MCIVVCWIVYMSYCRMSDCLYVVLSYVGLFICRSVCRIVYNLCCIVVCRIVNMSYLSDCLYVVLSYVGLFICRMSDCLYVVCRIVSMSYCDVVVCRNSGNNSRNCTIFGAEEDLGCPFNCPFDPGVTSRDASMTLIYYRPCLVCYDLGRAYEILREILGINFHCDPMWHRFGAYNYCFLSQPLYA